jgi:hypothetical protein
MLTIAPDSAWMISPFDIEMMASEYDGAYRISVFMASPFDRA